MKKGNPRLKTCASRRKLQFLAVSWDAAFGNLRIDPSNKCLHSLDLDVAGFYDDPNREVHQYLDITRVTCTVVAVPNYSRLSGAAVY